MSIIQDIRDKYARIAVVAIALALLGFILMDAFSGRGGMGSNGPSAAIGKVNGNAIDRIQFSNDLTEREAYYKQQGYQINEDNRFQVLNELWEQEVTERLLQEEYEKLGLTITEKELRDILYGANPPQNIAQAFTDPKTGKFDAVAAQQRINQMLKSKDPREKEGITAEIDMAKQQRLASKYMAMFTNTNYFPNWFIEKRNADNSLMASATYVSIPYSYVADSLVKVSDDEIKAYMEDHKEQYRQKEETRSISYVLFSAAPTSADSAAIKAQVEALKPQLAAATDIKAFITRESNTPFFDGYIGKTAMQVPVKDSLTSLPDGGMFGPYLDGDSYVVAKMIDSRMLPDSVKVRHILLGTTDPQTGQPLNDSLVKIRIDSIANAIRNGASFDSLETKYSIDQAAHQTQGIMTFSSTQIQSENFAKEFGQFILFDGKPGDKQNIKTQFGWHYIEIMEHKNVEPHYKIAYLSKKIVASELTNNEAINKATLFAGDSRDLETFNQNADKLKSEGINKFPATDLTAMSFNLPGISASARSLIKSIFEADQGDVIGPERIADNYVVAVVTEVNEPGMKSVNAVRPEIEPILKRKKQAAEIIKQIGQVTTLEQVATKFNQQVQPTVDSLRFNGPNLGYEPKVLGAIFNPANKGKVVPEPIPGTSAVYAIRVDNQTTTPVESAGIEEQRRMLEMQARQAGMNQLIEALKNSAKIKDNRAEFY